MKTWIIKADEKETFPMNLIYLKRNFPKAEITVYDSDPMEGIRAKLESIACLCVEGIELLGKKELHSSILKEALEGIELTKKAVVGK